MGTLLNDPSSLSFLSLIKGTTTSDIIPVELCSEIEPVFPVSASTDLRFSSQYQSGLAEYLCHSIAREPQDLRNHVRRILLMYEQKRESEVFGALLDLFIALDKKGFDLRKRMLESSTHCIDASQYHFLAKALTTGVSKNDAPCALGSMLSHGIEGQIKLVHTVEEKKKAHERRDPLTEAREYLEYSQLDEACSVLEQAIIDYPDTHELHEELLGIYRSTRDYHRFITMFEKLNHQGNPLLTEWQAMADYLRRFNVI